ncbi:MAG: hypothetical protein QM622_01525 [Microbacterium sp.]
MDNAEAGKKPSPGEVFAAARDAVRVIADDAERSAPVVPRRAHRQALGAALALVVVAVLVGILAGGLWPVAPIALVPTAYLIGWTIFVGRHVEEGKRLRDEDIVEVRWIERATSGAFFDVLVLTGWGSLVLWIASQFVPVVALPVSVVLQGVAIFAALSVIVRFVLVRRQELS